MHPSTEGVKVTRFRAGQSRITCLSGCVCKEGVGNAAWNDVTGPACVCIWFILTGCFVAAPVLLWERVMNAKIYRGGGSGGVL